ncbi:MAG: hypothetical protein C5B47_08980 [Verrucomicrobia bacterium]|nr:MAG: hypothetical protein C5B47_08980 [Verrucomicrobiota bacterium]
MIGWRRTLLRQNFFRMAWILSKCLLLSVAVAFLLASCKRAASVANVKDVSKEGLHLLVKSQYLPASVVAVFEKETGIPVRIQVCDSDVEMQGLFATSPKVYDILQPGESLAADLVHERRLAPLSLERIPNLRNVDSCFSGKSFDPSNQYTVPYLGGILGIVYNSAQIEGELKTYEDVFIRKYAGRIAIPDDNREIVACALAQLQLGFESVTPSNLEDVRKKLAAWLPLVGTYGPGIPPQTLLRRGDAVVAIMRSGEANVLMKEDPKFKWVVPPSGAHLFIESLAISKESSHLAAAEKFINFILRPDISASIAHQYPYFNPNRLARSLLPKDEQRCLDLMSSDFPKSTLQMLPPLSSVIFQDLDHFVEGIRPQ